MPQNEMSQLKISKKECTTELGSICTIEVREGHFGHWLWSNYKFEFQLPTRATKRMNLENKL